MKRKLRCIVLILGLTIGMIGAQGTIENSIIVKAAAQENTENKETSAENTAENSAVKNDIPADGEYAEGTFDFAWTGGSGRVTIDCAQIRVENGLVYAAIEFSSEHYTYVKVDGETYDEPDHSNGTSIFEVPVNYNSETTIIGQTTAMSTPHEIEYTLYVGDVGTTPEEMLAEAENETNTDANASEVNSASEETTKAESDATENEKTAENAAEENANEEPTEVQSNVEEETAGNSANENTNEETTETVAGETSSDTTYTAPEIAGLTYESEMELTYATCFSVYYYNDGYKVLDIHEHAKYLLVPEGMEAPEGLSNEFTVLYQPLDKIYLAATAVMSLFDSIDALDSIRLSGTEASGWYVENAAAAMENGEILYAGKYSEPDYELLISEGCDLAIESTMILHSPKVQEMIEDLGIPVLTDYSSYESHPLGRTEWIKFYGALLNKEDAAEEFFESQAQIVSDLKDFENTELTVAFFYVATDGTVVVRASSDYVPKMIEIAGGRYIFADLYADEGQKSSVSLTMEEFYEKAINADYLIYNATIDNPISSVDELLGKSELFADFKAVQEGNVYCCGKYLYQATNIVGTMIEDFHKMLTGENDGMTFLSKIA